MERTVTSNDAITDIGMLWEQAVRDYNKNEKTPLQFDKAGGNMQAAMKKIEAAEKSFKNHRHNKSRGDKVRTTLGNSLGCIQKCIDGMQMIGSAASAFPPAMPVELIFSAAGSLISVRKIHAERAQDSKSTGMCQGQRTIRPYRGILRVFSSIF